MDYSLDKLRSLPKGEFHNHLVLSISREKFNNRFCNGKLKFPGSYKGIPGMRDFIHENVNPNITGKDDVIKILELAIEDCIADGVVYLEASIDLNLRKHFLDNIAELIDTPSYLRNKYIDKIDFRPEIGFNKTTEKGIAYECAEACMESGNFYSIDIYGSELGVPVEHCD